MTPSSPDKSSRASASPARRGASKKPRLRGGKSVPTVSELSAGGVVVRRRQGRVHVALLRTEHARGEAWVLPKGHVELGRGESIEDAAVREVKEELGIADVRLKRPLGNTTYQFYTERGKIVKTVHYFLIEGLSEELHAQAEEGLLEARWMTVKEALRAITYPTDRQIILKAVSPRASGHRSAPATE